ncbi:MAG: hypothetical protein AAFX93_13985 [Verrucomicrobiota bacterium]
MIEVAQFLKDEQTRLALNQKDFAQHLAIDPATLSRIYSNQPVSMETFKQIYLRVSEDVRNQLLISFLNAKLPEATEPNALIDRFIDQLKLKNVPPDACNALRILISEILESISKSPNKAAWKNDEAKMLAKISLLVGQLNNSERNLMLTSIADGLYSGITNRSAGI